MAPCPKNKEKKRKEIQNYYYYYCTVTQFSNTDAQDKVSLLNINEARLF